MYLSLRATVPLATAFLLGFATLAQARTVTLSGNFVAATGVTTTPSGQFTGNLDTMSGKITYKMTYSGLSGPVIASHFHGPATAEQSAGVILPIPGPYESGMAGTVTANSATVRDILNGEAYVNLHTAKYPMGEARAQVKASP
jgi:hypothetical protein